MANQTGSALQATKHQQAQHRVDDRQRDGRMSFAVTLATTQPDLDCVKPLFESYAASLNVDLDFQNAREEFSSLPGRYAPPTGFLLLARRAGPAPGEPLGCIAVRKLSDSTCEMKRLYVSPPARGTGLGKALATRAIGQARAMGYERMVLDTLPHMTPALTLYRSLGFLETEKYYDTPLAETVFLELALKGP